MYSSHSLANAQDLERVQVQYITLPGWKRNISKSKKFSDLPKEAQNYIYKIEELVGVKGIMVFQMYHTNTATHLYFTITVKWIGVGADRTSTIKVF